MRAQYLFKPGDVIHTVKCNFCGWGTGWKNKEKQPDKCSNCGKKLPTEKKTLTLKKKLK